MNKATTLLLIVIATTFLFDFCFWDEKMGVNTLIFSIGYIAALLWTYPESRRSFSFAATAFGTVFAACMITWHNSWAAKFTWGIAAMCAAGFAQEAAFKFVLYAVIQYIQSIVFMPKSLFRSLQKDTPGKRRSILRKAVSLSILPILVVLVFYIFYLAANPKFAELSNSFWREVGKIFSFDISFAHVFFIIFALFLCGGALWYHNAGIKDVAADDNEVIERIRKKYKHPPYFPFMGLRREYQQAIILLGMLNALLLIVNLTDIRYVWFGFSEEVQKDLKTYVHEGTYALIASIFVAMSVLFYIFRKNLNFYPNNKTLKVLSTAWLIQNAVLAFSVGMRNARYIDFHGLAYKRIGVILFLLLVFFGLVTLWFRIRNKRTDYWLIRVNSWAVYGLMLLNASVAWDTFITGYNLSGRPKSKEIDYSFLVHVVSDKNLYQLEAYVAGKGANDATALGWGLKKNVEAKREQFERDQQGLSWKSWNWADSKNRQIPFGGE